MRNLKTIFKNIYIEKNININDLAIVIENLNPIIIDDYKLIFNRLNQDYRKQKKYPSLIIAEKKDNFLYPLSKYCDNYGLKNVYYTSNILNCIYDCKYCFLQGMYNSGYIVFFSNYKKLFNEIDRLDNAYINISYDTDLLAIDKYFNMISNWIDYINNRSGITIEIRTKSNDISSLINKDLKNVIIAYSLNPSEIIEKYELRSASLNKRVSNIKKLIDLGAKVQISFEPLIYVNDFKKIYKDLIIYLKKEIDLSKIVRFSISCFRISKDFLHKIQKVNFDVDIINYPFEKFKNMMSYHKELEEEMVSFIYNQLIDYKEKIFIFKGV